MHCNDAWKFPQWKIIPPNLKQSTLILPIRRRTLSFSLRKKKPLYWSEISDFNLPPAMLHVNGNKNGQFLAWALAPRITMKTYVYSIVVLGALMAGYSSWAATFNTTPAGGVWSAGTTWIGLSGPNNWGNHTANVFGSVTVTSDIQGYVRITLNNGVSFTSGSSLTLQNVAILFVLPCSQSICW